MLVRFWGTRGSIAKPGPTTVRYGGNTSCVQVVSDAGAIFVIDCGTGAHDLGQTLLREADGKPLTGSILISHTHWDHIQGIPFFAPLFVPGHRWNFYAPRGFGDTLRETLAGQMDFSYFPLTLDAFGADVGYHDLGEGCFEIADMRITTRFLNHPALTLAYRLECNGATIVYACDHEPHTRALASATGPIHGQDLDHSEFLRDADLVIHDSQYTPEEYENKLGWGHSTPQYAAMLCRAAGVKQLALTHHDPMRTDDQVDAVLADMRAHHDGAGALDIIAASEGLVLSVQGRGGTIATAAPSALVAPMTLPAPVVLVVTNALDPEGPLGQALAEENIRTAIAGTIDAIPNVAAAGTPSLVILDDDSHPAGITGAQLLDVAADDDTPPPLIVVSSRARPPHIDLPPDSDWIEQPFSREFMRARIRTALVRSQFRWMRPPLPDDEAERLAALHASAILDTPDEERFDRITRLAAALFDVPVALVSLVDADRQWFKSVVGVEARETPKETSFCAHAVAGRDMLVVADALHDKRFADNPLVAGPPHVRFYAGAPIHLPGGACAGTLCVIDDRPRDFDDADRARLTDLARIVEQEMAAGISSGA